eukprot:scaffold34658_cov230-Amphora_coffeaeformis.AAC.3
MFISKRSIAFHVLADSLSESTSDRIFRNSTKGFDGVTVEILPCQAILRHLLGRRNVYPQLKFGTVSKIVRHFTNIRWRRGTCLGATGQLGVEEGLPSTANATAAQKTTRVQVLEDDRPRRVRYKRVVVAAAAAALWQANVDTSSTGARIFTAGKPIRRAIIVWVASAVAPNRVREN